MEDPGTPDESPAPTRRGGAVSLLRRNREFRVLWSARAVSVLGDSLGLVALLVYLEAETGAAFAVALLLLAGDSVPGLFGPVAGYIGDRFGLRRVMVAAELIQGLLVLAIAATLPPLRCCSRSWWFAASGPPSSSRPHAAPYPVWSMTRTSSPPTQRWASGPTDWKRSGR